MPFEIQVMTMPCGKSSTGEWVSIRAGRNDAQARTYQWDTYEHAEKVMHAMYGPVVHSGSVRVVEVKR